MPSGASRDSFTVRSCKSTVAIANAQLYEDEQRRVARVMAARRVGQLITSSLSLDETLQTAVEASSQYLNYSSAGIFWSIR